jgi:polysaccharide export outer membrane protein
MRPIILVACGVWFITTIACAGPGPYVSVDDYAVGPAPDQPYTLAPGDVIGMRVFGQEQLATRVKVRDDGNVSLPYVNDVKAAGLTSTAVGTEVQNRLKEFFKNPLVTITVEEMHPRLIYVTGEVGHPGAFPIESAPGVLQALVQAGGLNQNGRPDRIFVLRERPNRTRIGFTYDALTRLTGNAASFRLQPGDVIVVE